MASTKEKTATTKVAAKKVAAKKVSTKAPVAKASTVTEEQIRVKAYEIYLKRNGQAGNQEDDWCQAKKELNIK